MPEKRLDPTVDHEAQLATMERIFGAAPVVGPSEAKRATFESTVAKRPTVCVDFDGVLNDYVGWLGAENLGEPRAGAREFMVALRERYRVIVLSTREPWRVSEWLAAHDIPADDVTVTKPPAVVYLDDRALLFDGSFDGLMGRITAFKAHWER